MLIRHIFVKRRKKKHDLTSNNKNNFLKQFHADLIYHEGRMDDFWNY